jgi:hypothetical protein
MSTPRYLEICAACNQQFGHHCGLRCPEEGRDPSQVENGGFTQREFVSAVDFLTNAHYHLMESKQYWYDKADMAASPILCGLASELRKELNA